MIIIRKIPVVAMLNDGKASGKTGTDFVMGNMQAIKDKSFFKFKIKIEYRKSIIKAACFLEKILRKLRLNVLKLDNFFNKWITILRENTKNNSENLSIEKTRLFEHNMRKFKEAAQKWPSQAYHIIEGGVEKSLVLIKTDNRGSKKNAVKDFFKKTEKIKEREVIQNIPKTSVSQAFNDSEDSCLRDCNDSRVIKPVQAARQNTIFKEERVYIEKIAKNPRDIEAYRMLGMLYVSQKNYSDALASFTEIVKKKKHDNEAENMILKIKGIIKKRQ